MIYLFGHTGFVGTGIAKYFIENGIEFIGIDRSNYEEYKNTECDTFINAAGNSKKMLATTNPRVDFEKNTLDTFNTLFDFKFKKYIYLSTIDVYNNLNDPEKNTEDSIIDPTSLSNYGFHKYMAEMIVKKYASSWIIVRLGGMIGLNLKKNAVYDLLTTGKLYVHPESGYQYIPTQYVGKILIKLLSYTQEIFNVCGDGLITPGEIAAYLNIPCDSNAGKKEMYEINIEKVKKIISIPKTRDAVYEFIDKWTKNPLTV